MTVQFAPAAAPGGNSQNALIQALLGDKSSLANDEFSKLYIQQLLGGNGVRGPGDSSPVQSWTQGAAQMANAYALHKALKDARGETASIGNALKGVLGGDSGSPSPMPAPQPSPPAVSSPMGALSGMGGIGGLASALAAGGPAPDAADRGPGIIPQAGPAMNAAPMPQPEPQQMAAPAPAGGGQQPIGSGLQAMIQGLMNPAPAANQSAALTGGNPAQGVDRSRIKSELDADPALARKYADMTFGEVRGQGPGTAQIQAETAADRALGRNIPLAQALMAVNDPNARQGGKNLGYYASDTYKRPANAQELAQFQNDILPKVLGGSEQGLQTLGFRPTGNASGQFAADRAASGKFYDNYAWPSGRPGRGEMFATEGGDTARMAKNLKSNFPPELLNPNMDAGNSFAPTQVAGDNVVPQAPQGPAVGQFTPGALPNVPTAQVRPTGPGDGPRAQMQQPQAMPQAAPQGQQRQFAQPERAQPQVPDNVRAGANRLIDIGTARSIEEAQKLVAPYLKPQQYGFQMTPDGTLIRTNPAMGSAEPVYQSNKPQFVPGATHDQYGNPIGGFVDATKQTVKLIGPNGQPIDPNAPSGGQGAMNDTHGEDYLKTLDPGKAETVKGIAEGRIPYPSGFIMKTPYGQWLTQAVGQYEPGIDATKIGQRKTFNQQMGSASPTSVGGQKTLMGTSLGHLGEIADAATSLGNGSGLLPSWVPGSAMVAHGTNYVANSSTTQSAKVNALNDAVQKFSGEVGKLYSGSSGGGIEERNQTRDRFSASSSPQEMAASLEMSKALIQSKLSALESQQDEIFGPGNKGRVDFLGNSGRAAIAKIDDAIGKLRAGSQPAPSQVAPAQSAPSQGGLPQGWSVKVH